MATIKQFEDIESCKLAKDFCARIGSLIDQGKLKKNYRLMDLMEGSSSEFRSQLYRTLNRNYVSQKEFDELFYLAIKISSLLQKIIEYLLKTEIGGSRKN
ncbi:MAG TPA: four helix bundle protein, partial [Chitinophagaceae bacterium]|nr:four helix bundle protein [Chitinophagaceae bacterium]